MNIKLPYIKLMMALLDAMLKNTGKRESLENIFRKDSFDYDEMVKVVV